MKRLQYLLITSFLITLFSCTENKKSEPHTDTMVTDYKEQYRPQFHFTPKGNWMNDPNGLVYNNGQWHMFYQHNPWGNKWGHMSWGHAVTRDLVHWGEMPIALYEEANATDADSTMIFSGSAIVDKGNKSKICPDGTGDCMIAFYTSHVHNKGEGIVQHQSLAYSADKGQTWAKYTKNPIIDLKEKDFRDPKVFWHQLSQEWKMAVVLPKKYKVLFYGSKDLVNWTKLSEWGGVGDISKIWECPDLFELKVANEVGVTKWVLVISGGHESKSTFGMQYFIGQFDGNKFTLDSEETGQHYLDYGRDFYAAVTWNNDPYKRRLMIGWMNNWDYANEVPTTPWKSAQSIVRQLVMYKVGEAYKLYQAPLREIESLRGTYGGYSDLELPCDPNLFSNIRFTSGEIQAIFTPAEEVGVEEFGLKVFQSKDASGKVVEETVIGYDPNRKEVFLDRSRSGRLDFSEKFSSRDVAPANLQEGKINLHVFIDESTIEVFVNHGEVVLSSQVFPKMNQGGIELYNKGDGRTVANTYNAWSYNSTWDALK
ncbi:MAG: glycoside hydrolase family 32 protein [Saprospiraceae bacterium]|jgi:fructan beta-fructosidase|nr:glycoside hydrolase family 32 protein [Saprospiraceae bacterium]